MAIDLDDVFAGIGLRRPHDPDQHLVDQLAGGRIDDDAVTEAVGGASDKGGLAPARRTRSQMDTASGPVMRTMPMAPAPIGVEIAAIVGTSFMGVLYQRRVGPAAVLLCY